MKVVVSAGARRGVTSVRTLSTLYTRRHSTRVLLFSCVLGVLSSHQETFRWLAAKHIPSNVRTSRIGDAFCGHRPFLVSMRVYIKYRKEILTTQ